MNEIEEIKRRIDIIELISRYLQLKKAGASFRALCPFHKETKPSFYVSPEKQIWHCFGCGKGGTIFDFIMEVENLEFYDALKLLAEKAGVKLEQRAKSEEQKGSKLKTKLFQINELSTKFFNYILLSHPVGKKALDYLKSRGVNFQTIKEFQIGFAPPGRSLEDFLLKKGFTDREIESAGSPTQFFNRIIFPISDLLGNVIAFTGRALSTDQEPKYLNTPETILYYKSRVLYGLDKARTEIKKQGKIVLVEGQMDLILSHQAGIKNIIACSGTAFTPQQSTILSRYGLPLIIAFDNDLAGIQASKKVASLALEAGIETKIASYKEKDPGEAVRRNPENFKKSLEEALPVMEWYFNQAFGKQKPPFSISQKKQISKMILPILRKIADPIERAHWIGILAKKLEVAERIIADALTKIKLIKPILKPEERRPSLSVEENLVGLLLVYPHFLAKVSSLLREKDFSDPKLGEIFQKLLLWYNKKERSGKPKINERADLLMFIIEKTHPAKKDQDIEKEIFSYLGRLKEISLEKLKEKYAQKIAQAEREGQRKKVKDLVKEFQEIIKR